MTGAFTNPETGRVSIAAYGKNLDGLGHYLGSTTGQGGVGVHLSVQQSQGTVGQDSSRGKLQPERLSIHKRLGDVSEVRRLPIPVSDGEGDFFHSQHAGECALLRRPRRCDGAAGAVPGGALVRLRKLNRGCGGVVVRGLRLSPPGKALSPIYFI